MIYPSPCAESLKLGWVQLARILSKQTEVRITPDFSLLLSTSGIQLVTVHSVHYRLGLIPATLPGRRSVFDRLSEQAPVKHRKRSISRDLPSASVNITGRGRELHRGRRASHDTSYSSPDPDYSPALGEVLVYEEGVF